MSNTIISGLNGQFGKGTTTKFWNHTGPASYIAGGETVTAFVFGLMDLNWVTPPSPPWTDSGAYFVAITYNPIVGGITPSVILKWFDTVTGVEVVNTTNLSGENIRLMVIGV